MNWLKPSWQAVSAIVLCLIAVALGPIAAPKVDALAQPAG
ncbi:ABC transporter permease, partial [Mesorhizobium sp. M7A.F.Ca.CA.004.02.1.1]